MRATTTQNSFRRTEARWGSVIGRPQAANKAGSLLPVPPTLSGCINIMKPNNSVASGSVGTHDPERVFIFSITEDVPRLFIVWSGEHYDKSTAWISADRRHTITLSTYV